MAGKDPGLIEVEKGRKYQLRVSAGRDELTGVYRRLNETFYGNRTEAKGRLVELRRQVAQGRHGLSKGTVSYLLDRHLDALRRRPAKPRTIYTYERVADRYVRPAVGEMAIADVQPDDIEALYDALLAKGLRRNTVQPVYAVLMGAFGRAERLGWVQRNPVRLAEKPGQEKPRPSERAPSREQVERIMVEAGRRNPDLAVLCFVAALTGLRQAELCGLRWRDLGAGALVVSEDGNICDLPGRPVERVAPKSSNGVRAFRLDEVLVGVLAAHREAMVYRAGAAGVTLGPDAYVWSQAVDGSEPYKPQRLSVWFGRVADRAGEGAVRFHDLRHFAGTELIDAGFNPAAVAARLGQDTGTLMRVYAARRPAADQLAADHMGRVLAPFGLPAGG